MVTTTLPSEAAQAQPHSSTSKLEDQAATAALYVTGNKDKQLNNNASANGRQFLDSDNKLSSAGAAASLKYAKPEDLPSYPTSGLKKNDSAAGAAASLGWANQKSFEHWKPDPSASASAAAMLAKDYKPAPMWKPEQSAAGAKAAVLANRDGAKVEIWKPEVNSWGNSAANQAFKKDRAGALSPQLDYGHTSLGRQGSLIAATGAMRNMNRKRSESTPVPVMPETYPDESNATANALRAATSAARKRTEQHSEGGSVPFTNLSRNMYTSHPPVAPEVEEKNRADVLHASAVAMAQGMYKLQQKQFEQTSSARSAANAAHGQRGHVRSNSTATSTADEELAPMRFNNLQEAAQRLAQERLSKLYGDHDKNRDYREYYGSSLPSSRMSIRGRPRRRASSDGDLVEDDRAQSNKIRQQMSLFSNKLSEVDQKKRQQDRENLIAVAQRNVTKSLHGMDEKVFADTGKVAPSLLNEWEVKAHAAAQSKSDTRMEDFSKDKSRVHIGKGVFIDQSAVDLVAARNVQPVLDEINEKAEKERVRQAELKLEQENQQRKAAETKAHEKEKKDINKKLKQQDKEERKMKEDEEKAERKVKENEEKAAKAEEKRLAKEKRKSTTPQKTEVLATGVEDRAATETAESPTTATTIADRREGASTPAPIRTSMEMQAEQRMKENADAANKGEITPLSPTSSPDGSKVKNWLKTKFRRSSRGQKSKDEGGEKGFVGGAAYTGATFKNTSSTSINRKSDSVRDVALAGKTTEIEQEVAPPSRTQTPLERPTSEVSSVSSLEDDGDEFEEARDNFDEGLAPPPTFPAGPAKSSSPVRDSRFKEAI